MKEKYEFTMRELPNTEQPYERCEKYGPSILTDAELISVLLKSGTREEPALKIAQRLLKGEPGGQQGLERLFSLKYPDYIKINGIGRVKAITLLCAVELSGRLTQIKKSNRICFNDSGSVAEYYMASMRHLTTEHLVLLLLNNKNQLIKEMRISSGTVNSVMASPREVMIEAVRYEAVRFILLHNHPSGDPTPSRADILITQKMEMAGTFLDISLLDHIVIGDGNYISMRQNELI